MGGANLELLAPLARGFRRFVGGRFVSFWFLLLLATVGNLAIGFGIGLHFGFGPDLTRVHSLLRELVAVRRRQRKSKAAAPPAR